MVLNKILYNLGGFCVNCILEIHGILNMLQVLNVPRF